jgi:hypothetical protein
MSKKVPNKDRDYLIDRCRFVIKHYGDNDTAVVMTTPETFRKAGSPVFGTPEDFDFGTHSLRLHAANAKVLLAHLTGAK